MNCEQLLMYHRGIYSSQHSLCKGHPFAIVVHFVKFGAICDRLVSLLCIAVAQRDHPVFRLASPAPRRPDVCGISFSCDFIVSRDCVLALCTDDNPSPVRVVGATDDRRDFDFRIFDSTRLTCLMLC